MTGEWVCKVCGQPSPRFRPPRGRIGAADARNAIALPCGHEQPSESRWVGKFHYVDRGLEYRRHKEAPCT